MNNSCIKYFIYPNISWHTFKILNFQETLCVCVLHHTLPVQICSSSADVPHLPRYRSNWSYVISFPSVEFQMMSTQQDIQLNCLLLLSYTEVDIFHGACFRFHGREVQVPDEKNISLWIDLRISLCSKFHKSVIMQTPIFFSQPAKTFLLDGLWTAKWFNVLWHDTENLTTNNFKVKQSNLGSWPSRWRNYNCLKHQKLFTSWHDIISQKISIFSYAKLCFRK